MKVKDPYVKQEPPNSIQITPVEGCNFRCTFCGVQAITTRPGQLNGIMPVAMASAIAANIARAGWNPRIEINQQGEPTMHPEYWNIVAAFRKCLPKAYILMTSNGGGLLRSADGTVNENIHRLFKAGLNTLALDDYIAYKLVPRIEQQYSLHRLYPLYHYPADPQGNPHRRHTGKLITVLQDITISTKGTHSSLNNHAGLAFEKNDYGKGKRCARPFREMSIRVDGNVALCCVDWRGVYKIGSVLDTPIEDLWNNPRYEAARRKLVKGERTFGVCTGCDVISYRVGLLPDKLGKQAMPEPDAHTDEVIAEACGGGTLAPVVLRPWEITEMEIADAKRRAAQVAGAFAVPIEFFDKGGV